MFEPYVARECRATVWRDAGAAHPFFYAGRDRLSDLHGCIEGGKEQVS